MLFSHRVSLVLLAPTSSEMKEGHLCGQSCFRIWTEARFFFENQNRRTGKKERETCLHQNDIELLDEELLLGKEGGIGGNLDHQGDHVVLDSYR